MDKCSRADFLIPLKMPKPGGFYSRTRGTERETGASSLDVAAQKRMLVDSFTIALVEPHVTILPVHLISGMWGPLQVQRDPKQSAPRSETDLQGHSDTHFQIWSQVLDTLQDVWNKFLCAS